MLRKPYRKYIYSTVSNKKNPCVNGLAQFKRALFKSPLYLGLNLHYRAVFGIIYLRDDTNKKFSGASNASFVILDIRFQIAVTTQIPFL